jgi:hypothetical protein
MAGAMDVTRKIGSSSPNKRKFHREQMSGGKYERKERRLVEENEFHIKFTFLC